MSQIFDLDTTRQQQIIVEYLTPTGSAFAVNPQGEQVFLNSRLVVAMKVQAGDIYNAFLLPNYPDKKDQIPWRAMRVEPEQVDLELGHVKKDSLFNRIEAYMRSNDKYGAYEACEIAEDLEVDQDDVTAVLKESFDRVDAYVLRTADR
tara:strand:+ start:250 stop:693 length:444 start_codon:yes stop_codon:yes gene_type:complete